MRKLITTLVIFLIILPAMFITAMAADNQKPEITEEQKAAEILWKLGLFHAVGFDEEGTPDFAIDFFTTRIHGLIIFISFIGEEDIALSGSFDSPYDDVIPELRPYVEYAYEQNYLQGMCITKYDPDSMVTAQHFLTTALGILGYENSKDFEWYKSWTLSDEIKLTDGKYNKNNYKLTRGEMAVLLLRMLGTKLNGSDMTLLDRLIEDGVFDENAKKGLIMDDDLLEAIRNGDKDKIRNAIKDIIVDDNKDSDKSTDDKHTNENNTTDNPNNPGNNKPGGNNPGNNNPGSNNPGGNKPGDNDKPKDCDCEKQDNKECEKCKDSDNKKDCDCEKHECEKPVCDHECEKPVCDHSCEDNKCEHKCEDHECCKHECQDCKNHECDDISDKDNCNCPVCPNCEDKRICDDPNCSDPDCDQHGDKSKDCDNPEGCDDPDCPDCNHIEPCDNPECPFCKEPEDDCDSPDGCGDTDCENCAKTDCDSENGCDGTF